MTTNMLRDEAYRKTAVRIGLDVVAPLALYYGLRGVGANVWWALLAAGLPPLYMGARELLVRRRVDRIALTVLALMVVGTLVSLLSGSAELLMARGSFGTAVFGTVILCSRLRGGRPLMLEMVGYVLPAEVSARWESQWRDDAAFRRGMGWVNTGWGVAFLLDAAARVVMAYTLPLDLVPLLGIAVLVVLLVTVNQATKRYLKHQVN